MSAPTPRDLLPDGGRAPADHRHPGVVAPSRLRASWQRSRSYGVSPDRPQPVFVGVVPTDSLFYECGSEVLRGLAATVANEPISFMATDATGLVLVRLCEDDEITRSLDRVHLAPGFGFDESAAGTNGLGLALADRTASLVRAGDHFCTELRAYTCAAVPVTAPDGTLAGSINLTTWSDASSELLLALAQAAAGTTAALMQARSGQAAPPALHRGEVYRMVSGGWPDGPEPCTSRAWGAAVDAVRTGLGAGHVVAVLGEPGSGRAAAAARALRRVRPGHRIVRAPFRPDDDAPEWLTRWLPELARPATTVLAGGLEHLPAWAVDDLVAAARAVGRPAPLVVTAPGFEAVPRALVESVGAVAEIPPLRRRPEDVLPLAHEFARQERRRWIEIAPSARRVLEAYDWPGNATQLRSAVRTAVTRADVVEANHLPAEVFTGRARPLSRLERVEREEIVRCLTEPGVTVAGAAENLGLSRATLYRKVAHYGLELPGRSKG